LALGAEGSKFEPLPLASLVDDGRMPPQRQTGEGAARPTSRVRSTAAKRHQSPCLSAEALTKAEGRHFKTCLPRWDSRWIGAVALLSALQNHESLDWPLFAVPVAAGAPHSLRLHFPGPGWFDRRDRTQTGSL